MQNCSSGFEVPASTSQFGSSQPYKPFSYPPKSIPEAWEYIKPKPAFGQTPPRRIWCDLCGDNELVSKIHFKCTECPDFPGFDVCDPCFNLYKYSEHFNKHKFIRI